MRLPLVVFCLLLMACISTAGQTSNTNAGKAKANSNSGANRKPIFRAEQGAVVVRRQTTVFVHFAVEASSNTGAVDRQSSDV